MASSDSSSGNWEEKATTDIVGLCKNARVRESSCVKPYGIGYDIDNDGIFADFPKHLIKALNTGLDGLMDETNWMGYISLTPLKILNSNAADCHEGYSFSKAYCCTEKYSTRYSFGSVFRKGLSMLIEFMLHRTVPNNKQEKYVLSKLLHYLYDCLDTDAKVLKNMEMYTETELTTVIANHLFGKLSTSSLFTIDKQCKGKCRGHCERGNKKNRPSCPCEMNDCILSGDFGDTSIGNWMVWHGNVDIIINNEVVVVSQDTEEKDSSPKGKSPVEVKLKSSSLSRNPQVIAQNIVFSFLQKLRHPESDNFLFPCIGVTGKDMIVYFYDSVNDVLLESTLIPLHGMIPSAVTNINLVAIVVSWLVVNYKYLCDGVMEEMKAMKAEFFSQAKGKLNVYKTELKAGEVGNACPTDDSEEEVRNLHHPLLMDLKKRKRLVVLEPSEN